MRVNRPILSAKTAPGHFVEPMHRFALFMTVFIGRALAQTAADPVLVVHGICSNADNAPQDPDHCAVAVSRTQFDELLTMLSPGSQTSGVKGRLAKMYAETQALDRAARDRGIDRSAEYQIAVRWLEDKALADLLRKRLESESNRVTAEEVAAYYEKRRAQFEVVKLQRLVLPKTNFAAADRQMFDQDLHRVAGELRERAARGEDIDELQKQGYAELRFSGQPPVTQVGTRRRTDLPAGIREEVFSLRPGEASKVENETYSLVIYKVEAKWTLPEEQVIEEITRDLTKEKLDRALYSITGSIRMELNQNYFGTTSAQ